MDFINEIIGLIILVFAFLFPVVRGIILEKRRKKLAEEKEQQPPQALPPPEAQTPPKTKPRVTTRLVRPGYEFHADLEDFKRETHIETRELETQVHPEFKETVVSKAFVPFTPKAARRKNIHMQWLFPERGLKKLVIFSEILGPPKSLREDEY